MKPSLILSIGLLSIMVLTGGSCKKDPPVGPPACDTCKTDTTHHTGPNDTTSHTFTWSQYTLPNEGILTGAWVFGPKNVWVVGGAVWKWNGTKWFDVSPSDASGSWSGALSGFSMFAFSEDDYWLTHSGTIIHSVTGSSQTYSFGSSTVNGPLHASWGTSSSNDMYSVGDGGTILHFDGTQWTKMQSGTTKDLHSIWGTSSHDIWASGTSSSKGTTILLHYDGTSWLEDPISVSKGGNATGGFDYVWACDSSGHHFVTTCGALLDRKTDNGAWRSDSGSLPNRLSDGSFIGIGVRGNTPNDLIVAGSWGFIAHWNGRSWYQYTSLYDYSNPSYGLGGMSIAENTICLVGLKDGASWIAIGQR